MAFKSNRNGKAAILSSKQLQQLNEYLPEKYSLLAEVLLWSAGRVYETSTIKVRNINFKEETIVLETKNAQKASSTLNIIQLMNISRKVLIG